MAGFPTLKTSWPWHWPWPWIGSCCICIPSCITHRPLHTCQISLQSKKRFVYGRMQLRTYGTDVHLKPALLGLLCRRLDLKKGVRGLFGSFKNESSRLVRSVWFRFYSHKWTSRFTANRPNTNGLMHAQIVYAYYMYTLRTFFILYYLL